MTAVCEAAPASAAAGVSVLLTARVAGERTLAVSGLPAAELVDLLRRALGDDLRLLPPTDREHGLVERLSNRERSVIALVSRGLSNRQIATTLFLSNNTVKTYIRTAYRKIGATTRSEAVLWGAEHGYDALPVGG